MINIFNKRKSYIVEIITNKKINEFQIIEVKAKNKQKAINMVNDVLLKCEYFGFVDKNEYKLKIKKWREK